MDPGKQLERCRICGRTLKSVHVVAVSEDDGATDEETYLTCREGCVRVAAD
jgi:hypothetical protein